MHNPIFRQFFRFAAVGLSGTGVQYACVAIAIAYSGKAATVTGSAIGYVLGSIVNYVLNYFLTFGSGKSHIEAASKYFAVLAIGWCLNLGLMSLFVHHWDWHPWLSQFITTGIGLCWNFSGSRLWAFKETRIK
ncbi:MAG: GtrA family protein [Undibacterium sp.]|uniref:GtrA family protein n=1 Tax=Undibacterium sp. TaxID=1914977 RepID=UPI002725B7FE|nr:GtrA family protein [Undibacterium sp.]MDO8650823.1 GtrA family protein [Undibacterium sp.]